MGKRFRKQRKVILVGLLSVVLMMSVAVVGPGQKPAAAALNPVAVSDIAQSVTNVFNWLPWDGQAAVDTAKQNLTELSVSDVTYLLWPATPPSGGYLLPLRNGVTEQAAGQLLYDMFHLMLAGPDGFLSSQNIDDLAQDEGTVTALLPQANLLDLYTFFADAQKYGLTKQPGAVETLQDIFTGNSVGSALTSSQVDGILSDALRYVGTHAGQDGIAASDATVYQQLTSDGWTVEKLVQAELLIDQAPLSGGSVVDPGYRAEIGLLKTYVRSQAHLSIAAGSPGNVETAVIHPHQHVKVTITIAGTNVTSPLTLIASDPSVHISGSGSDRTISAADPIGRPVQITAYCKNAQEDWVYKGVLYVLPANVKVTGQASASTGSTSLPAAIASSTGNPVAVTASGGTGTVTVLDYSGSPVKGNIPFDTRGASFFDVHVASPADTPFATVAITAPAPSSNSTAYWWTGSSWQKVNPQTNAAGQLTMTLSGTSSPTAGQLAGTLFAVTPSANGKGKGHGFRDVTGDWAAKYIEALDAAGIMTGYPDGTFRPGGDITRAEFIATLVRAEKLTLVTDYSDLRQFADYAGMPGWAKPYLATAVADHLVNGSAGPAGTVIEANELITREEMGVMIGRTYTNAAPATLKYSDDNLIPAGDRHDLGVAVAKGIINGYPDGSFQPLQNADRNDAAVMIARFMGLGG